LKLVGASPACQDALPDRRLDAFVVLSKLAPFTPEEIETRTRYSSDGEDP
jgi:hypothetical protein